MNIQLVFQIFLMAFSVGLSWFCFSLARKIKNLNSLENGLGGAIAVMISEVERLERAIQEARSESAQVTKSLSTEIDRAKEERAFWALQRQFTSGNGKDGRVLVRKRQLKSEARNEA